MKVITIWQPWASLLACGAKQYETRSWATNCRGPIAIHAGLKNPNSIVASFSMDRTMTGATRKALGEIDFGALPRGVIIATAELVECWEIHGAHSRGASYKEVFIEKDDPNDSNGLTWIEDNELLFGDFTPGRYAWEFANMKMLPEPIPAKGRQGLWNWEERRV